MGTFRVKISHKEAQKEEKLKEKFLRFLCFFVADNTFEAGLDFDQIFGFEQCFHFVRREFS